MRVPLVEVAEELIEAVLSRQPAFRRADVAESPLADECRAVAGLLQDLGNRDVVRLQRLSERIRRPRVATNARATVMLSRHQDTA